VKAPDYVTYFLATADGLALTKAFMGDQEAKAQALHRLQGQRA
jgi:hypothetical protein